MGKTKSVEAFGEDSGTAHSWQSCPRLFTWAHQSCWSVLNNQRSIAISWTQWQQHVCCSVSFVCLWSRDALERVLMNVHIKKVPTCVPISMQLCVKFACWLHLCACLYVCVCVCVSVCLMAAGWLSCCIVMSYGCLSGSCSDNLFSQLALPRTYTQVYKYTTVYTGI